MSVRGISMALFGKRKKSSDAESEEVTVKSRAKRGRSGGRNRNDMLTSVFSETVMDQAVSEMRENTEFDVEIKGHPFHVLWLLKASDIGGLNKRMKNNGDHGAIIQCMSNGNIKYVLNGAMNKADYVAFIMDADTVEHMDEFSLLKEPTYHAMYVSDEDPAKRMLMDADVELTFEDARDVLEKRANIMALLKSKGSVILATADAPVDPLEHEVASEFVDGSRDISSPTVSPDTDVNVEADEIESIDEPAEEMSYAEEVSAVDGVDDFSAIDAALGAEPVSNGSEFAMNREAADAADIARQANPSTFEREVYPAEAQTFEAPPTSAEIDEFAGQVAEEQSAALVSRYFTSDLGLTIDGDAFDSHFGEGMPIAYFDEDRGEGMLNEYLSQMSISANSELAQMHGQHMYSLRERYMRMLTLFADSLVEAYDISSTNNAYGQAYAQLLEKFAEDNSDDGIQRMVEPRKTELKEEFESRVQAAGEAAARSAENTYRELHTDEYRSKLRDIEAEVRVDVESTHVSEVNRLNELRRLAAAREFDLGRERILEQISRIQAEYMQQEDELYRYHLRIMNKWIDDNRKDDIAYAETLREQQRQLEEAERVRNEYAGYVEAERNKFEQSQARMEAELAEAKARNADFIEDLNRRHGLDLDAAQAKYDELQKSFDELMAKYDALGEEKEAEWAERVASAREEAKIERKRYNKLSKQNHSVNMMWVALAVVIAIAAFFIGMILGLRQSIDYSSALVVQNSQQQQQKQAEPTAGTIMWMLDE